MPKTERTVLSILYFVCCHWRAHLTFPHPCHTGESKKGRLIESYRLCLHTDFLLSKELTPSASSHTKKPLPSSLQEHHLREHSTRREQVSYKEESVFLLFCLQQNLPFFLKPIINQKYIGFKKMKRREQLSNIHVACFPRGCVYDVPPLEKNIMRGTEATNT